MFGFDDRFAMFDITPVENQFILEYLPEARGDYVKVYLYGLMHCYHPEEGMNPDRVSHDLNMTTEDVYAAFRYWERKRLVRRVSDDPPVWQYVNIKQINLTAGDEPEDEEFRTFSNALYEVFDKSRRLHGSELVTCFEWKEELKLPTEVIIMLLNHMVEIKGKNFSIREAEKVALRMAEENVRTAEEAEDFFTRDEMVYAGVRKILKLMGKRYLPSEAQVNMYQKWIREWHFTPEAVEEALKLTAKGDPSMGYLDGILKSLRNDMAGKKTIEAKDVSESTRRTDELKTVLRELGSGEVNEKNLQLFNRMREMYPLDVILTAARECGHNKKEPEDILKLLESWKEKGLESREDVDAYVRAFHDQTGLIRELRAVWGTDEKRIGKQDRAMVSRWENELGFGRDMILAAAPYAAEAKAPMAYLDRILADYHSKGIRTAEQAAAERTATGRTGQAGGKTKGVSAQDYPQRPYEEVQRQLMDEQRRRITERLGKNGGNDDA